jgi:hypothetical protein
MERQRERRNNGEFPAGSRASDRALWRWVLTGRLNGPLSFHRSGSASHRDTVQRKVRRPRVRGGIDRPNSVC